MKRVIIGLGALLVLYGTSQAQSGLRIINQTSNTTEVYFGNENDWIPQGSSRTWANYAAGSYELKVNDETSVATSFAIAPGSLTQITFYEPTSGSCQTGDMFKNIGNVSFCVKKEKVGGASVVPKSEYYQIETHLHSND